MKKVKISGKELHRLGYTTEVSKSLVKTIISKHYKGKSKAEVLEMLDDVIKHTEKYRKHNYFSQIIESLSPAEKTEKQEISILNDPLPYKIYGLKDIDDGSIQQMDLAMRLPISRKGALMPDAHQGYGLPIGGVLATENAVVPYGVGMDIGCRMCMSVYSIKPSSINSNATLYKKILQNETRFGNDEFNVSMDHEVLERKEFREISFLKSLHSKAYKQIGTSGHGNHFVDIGELEILDPENEWKLPVGNYFAILSHSGSRGFGAEIARHYTRLAKDKCLLPKSASNLSWLDLSSDEGKEYWSAMNLAGDYSRANHEQIHKRLSNALKENIIFKVENHHNFAWKEKIEGKELIVHRKGATPTKEGDLGIIPGSMASPAFIVRGKGNPESLYSAAHGAGRLMSRKAAKQRVSKKEMLQYLAKNKVELLGGNIDEAPWVYKDIHKVMAYQKDLVEIVAKFTPRIVRMA